MKNYLIVLVLFLTACGGGSSSDSSGGGSTGGSNGVRILHGLIDHPPLDLYVAGLAVQTAKYGNSTGFFSSASGSLPVSISIKNNPGDVVAGLTASLDGKSKTSILVFGSDDSGVRSAVIAEGSPVEGGSVRIVNAANGAGALVAKINGVSTNSAVYGGASDYVATGSGVQNIVITRVTDGATVFAGNMNISGRGNTILVSGIVGYFVSAVNYPS